MKKFIAGLTFSLFFLIGFFLSDNNDEILTLKRSQIILGTLVEIQIMDQDSKKLESSIKTAFKEIERVDSLFSKYNRTFLVSTNKETDTMRNIPAEIFNLIQTSDKIWKNTNGAFDASLNNLVKIWGFDTKSYRIPRENEIKNALQKSGWKKIRISGNNCLIRKNNIEFNFNGIAKGYAVDRAIDKLRESGIYKAIVNAGGEIKSFGDDWIIGIQDPRNESEITFKIKINDKAVATSGDYENYFIKDGMRYHHLLNPETGYPALECRSVTIIGNNCTIVDAYSTGIFVMGVEKGLALIENLKGIEGFIIDKTGQSHYSSGFKNFIEIN